jgi:protein-disulfide isomerase
MAAAAILASLAVVGGFRLAEAQGADKTTTPASGMSEKVLHFVREKFGIADSVNISIQPFHDAVYPGFYETTITVGDGNDKRTSTLNVSRNGRYLILNNFVALGRDPKLDIAQHVRETFKVPANVHLTVGNFLASPYPSFYQTTVAANDGKQVQRQVFFVTRDERFLVLGGIFNINVDLRQQALHTLTLHDQPFQGPPDAPVTIVEFADLECPSCAREHEFLQKELLPRYGDKVRLVYKEFPLVQAHPWALTAAIASQCAYEINPQAFVPFHSMVYQNQTNINAATARDLLLYYGQQVGIDRVQLAACIDSKASLGRVKENLREGQELGISSTPTFFINGRMLVGSNSADILFQEVDRALRAAR